MTAHRFLIRPLSHSTIMSDAFAALNGGLHQLIQFLYLDLTGKFRLLTTRGHSTDLNGTSREIFRNLQGRKDEGIESQRLISRITWLSQYTRFPMAMSKELSPLFVFTLALISIGFFSFSTYAVNNAIQYHPTYVERIEGETLALEEKIVELEERGNDNEPN